MATGYLQNLLGENYEDEKRSALNMGLLSAGLQGLAASGPSLMPVSAGQVLGQAGMAGLAGYQDQLAGAERGALQGMELDTMREQQESQAAFKAALPQVFQNGKINYEAAQQLALAYPEQMGQVMSSLKATQAPKPPGRKTEIIDIFNDQGEKIKAIVDTNSGKIISQIGAPVPGETPSQEDVNKQIATARKEFTSLPPVKEFASQAASYGRIVASADNPSPAGDLALIFNYMKVLDPGSAVRETEFANAQNAGSVPTRIRSLYNNVLEGTRLTAEQRKDFVNRGTRIYKDAERQYEGLSNQYREFAETAGLPSDQIIPNFRYAPKASNVPPPPEGMSGSEWAGLWNNMTPKEREQFTKDN